jgi:hypothetical protein
MMASLFYLKINNVLFLPLFILWNLPSYLILVLITVLDMGGKIVGGDTDNGEDLV